MKASAQPELLRAIGRWSLVALTINCIIGSGIFGLPALIAGQLGRWAPLGYLVAAAGVGAIMGCFAEVASRFTDAGGPYLYAQAAFGSFVGIEIGWLTWLVRLAASAASANLFVDYLGQFLPALTTGAPRVVLITAVVGAVLVVNVRGVRSGARLSNFFTVAKLVPLLVLMVAGAVFLVSSGWHADGPLRPRQAVDALVLLVFAYGGFESAMIPLGEARDPRRDAPFALAAALVCCTVVFTSIQIVVMGTLSDPASTPRPLAAAAQVTMGGAGALLLTAGALFSTYGLLSANVLNVPRLTYALARQGQFPSMFAATHPRFRTPHVSIAVFAVLLWGLAIAGGFRWNAVLSTVSRIFTYAVVCAALPVLRRKQPGQERFHLRGGTLFAAVGIAFCALVGTRIGRVELLILLITAAIAALNWWWARRKQLAGGTMNKLIATVVLAAVAAPRAEAQEKPASPPPIWQQGKAPEMADSKLAPHPGKMTETPPAEIPLHRIRLPEQFRVELWAHGLPGGRAMARGDKGKIYVGTRAIGRVYEITDQGDRRTVRVLVDKLVQPAGVAFANGSLYVAAVDKMLRYDGIEDKPDVAPLDLTSKFDLPPEQHHNWKYIAFGPDKKLYVPFGAPCNICEPPPQYAQIRRYEPDGSRMEVIARGIRNSIGFDWHPRTGELWFTDNGRDWMGEEGPEDELNRISSAGLDFGFPYCHAAGVPDSQIKKQDPCKGVTLPVALLGPHTAALGMIFYTGRMFPAAYREAIFVARKGSWNRTKLSGFDVVRVKADAAGKKASVTPFMTGFMDAQANTFWGRPAYVLQMPDGALLVSDEQNGAIYRISYRK